MYRHTASPVSLWPKVRGLRPGYPSSNLSVSLRSTRPGCGTQRLLRCRLHPAGRGPNSDSLFPPLAAVVAVAPGRGASGEEAKLCGMPRPPLGRGGGTASAVTERLSLARASRSGHPSSNLSVSLRSTAPLVGEPLARRQGFAECQGLPSVGEVARRRRDGEVEFSKSFPVRLSFVQPLSLLRRQLPW